MKTLLIAYCSQTGNTETLSQACYQAALACAGDSVHIIYKTASEVSEGDMRCADAYIFATPENFGYMNGQLKFLFDRTYEQVREETAGRSYALLIACGNDGSGAKASVERILSGYSMKNVGQCLIVKGLPDKQSLYESAEIGRYMVMALDAGVI